jgi:hypothetical protein
MPGGSLFTSYFDGRRREPLVVIRLASRYAEIAAFSY